MQTTVHKATRGRAVHVVSIPGVPESKECQTIHITEALISGQSEAASGQMTH